VVKKYHSRVEVVENRLGVGINNPAGDFIVGAVEAPDARKLGGSQGGNELEGRPNFLANETWLGDKKSQEGSEININQKRLT
jgi:hypothetical protein